MFFSLDLPFGLPYVLYHDLLQLLQLIWYIPFLFSYLCLSLSTLRIHFKLLSVLVLEDVLLFALSKEVILKRILKSHRKKMRKKIIQEYQSADGPAKSATVFQISLAIRF